MGWNAGYGIFEATVVGAYDLGKLDEALLSVLMEPYRDTDIDSGGKQNLVARDGKGIEEIVIETWGLDVPKAPAGDYDDDEPAWRDYYDALYERMCVVTDHFGWG